jgi:hypothetical protein
VAPQKEADCSFRRRSAADKSRESAEGMLVNSRPLTDAIQALRQRSLMPVIVYSTCMDCKLSCTYWIRHKGGVSFQYNP